VLFLIHSLQAGGMERVMSELAQHFSSRTDTELHLILYGINREVFYTIPENIFLHKPAFGFNKKRRFWFTMRTLSYLRNKIKSIDPVVILSFGEYWNSFVLISLLGTQYPVFVSDRAQPNKSLGWKANFVRRWLYPQATGIIAQTRRAQEIYQRLFGHPNIKVIGNPIRQIASNTEKVEKENIVLSVGRLIKSKNHDLLINIFAAIDNPDWKLVIVGYDHLGQQNREKLENLIRELNMQDKILLVGKQVDVNSYYLKSKIFAFTSSSEGFPNVIGEAMSAGLPVVAFDCEAGPSEMIKDNENGYLIPLFDNIRFQKKLRLLMNNQLLREELGTRGKKDIKAFSLDYIGEEYYNFITNKLAKSTN
jgi:glycosyltransferase involved in cell wall biosynthesis